MTTSAEAEEDSVDVVEREAVEEDSEAKVPAPVPGTSPGRQYQSLESITTKKREERKKERKTKSH